MAGTSNYPNPQLATTQMPIVSPKFCVPDQIDLVINKKFLSLTEGDYRVADINGNKLFKVDGKVFSLRERRILLDRTAGDLPLLTFRQKLLSVHNRWKVYRGDSSEETDLLFSAKMSSFIQFGIRLNVYLAANTSEDAWDFKVEGKNPCTIYSGDRTKIVAQIYQKGTVKSFLLGMNTYKVTVYPNVDYAFIVTLIVILEEINNAALQIGFSLDFSTN